MKTNLSLKDRLKATWKTVRITANLMVGIHDYDQYVAQQRKHNPNAPVMTKLEFLDYCRKKTCSNGRCC